MTITAKTTTEIRTIIFCNHMPMRTRQEEYYTLLRHDYLDFGGHYFCYCKCAKEPGKYHAWFEHNMAYDTDPNYKEYLGTFGSYDELLPLIRVDDADTLDYEDCGKILRFLGGVIDVPEC